MWLSGAYRGDNSYCNDLYNAPYAWLGLNVLKSCYIRVQHWVHALMQVCPATALRTHRMDGHSHCSTVAMSSVYWVVIACQTVLFIGADKKIDMRTHGSDVLRQAWSWETQTAETCTECVSQQPCYEICRASSLAVFRQQLCKGSRCWTMRPP